MYEFCMTDDLCSVYMRQNNEECPGTSSGDLRMKITTKVFNDANLRRLQQNNRCHQFLNLVHQLPSQPYVRGCSLTHILPVPIRISPVAAKES